MKECVYCGNEIKGNGIYFCNDCKKSIKKNEYVNTGNVIGDWIAKAYWYLEENNGNYWKNVDDIPEEERKLQFVRPIDYIRFDEYRKSLGKEVTEFPMCAENLNKMEQWYLNLARKEKE
jgi:hypothetical protein